jgi:hypothetical protein
MSDTQFKVIVILEDGVSGPCSAVEYQDAIWLVPKWLPCSDAEYAKPERMIRLDQFRYQRIDPPVAGEGPLAEADFVIDDPIPRALFEAPLTPQLASRFSVLDRPDATFRVGGAKLKEDR